MSDVSHGGGDDTVLERSSARRAERGIALVAPAMRAIVVVQILLSFSSGLQLTDNPTAYVVMTVAVAGVSVLLIVQCLTTRTVLKGAWHYPDLVLAWIVIPAMVVLMPPAKLVGTWEVWAAAFAINVAALSAAWLKPVTASVLAVGLGAWYFVWMSGSQTASWQTNLNNALTIPGYAIVVALLAHYLRALASDADQSREDAIVATRALELQRYQLTVHDATSILRLLSDDDTPAEVLPGLRVQADREARRLRNYLGKPSQQPRARQTVGSMLDAALEGFDDLPLEVAIELGAHVQLTDEVWHATRGAVTTVLHNVRIHSGAQQVVVHADSDDQTWEVVVSDDGVGFDAAGQPLGFGLGTQVRDALAEFGVSAEIRSAPGRGTAVTIIGFVNSEENP